MLAIVSDRPYRFVPPYRSQLWTRTIGWIVKPFLHRAYGIEQFEYRGLERMAESIRAGHGILLAPNHPRPCDPFVMGWLSIVVGPPFFMMASWHLFMNGGWRAWALHRLGGFSIYREGMDRASLGAAVEIVAHAERPLVIFPEGYISLANDRINPLLEGTAFVARAAARKRAKLDTPGKVVVHPIGLRYEYLGDVARTLTPVLSEFERRLTLTPDRSATLLGRVARLGMALLALKELQYLGAVQPGTLAERLERLIDRLLVPLEARWLGGEREKIVPERVRRIRSAIMPVLQRDDLSTEQRDELWKELDHCYLAQQLYLYPPDYLHEGVSPQRLLETVERMEEDLTDRIRTHRPRKVTIEIGHALEVPTDRGAKDEVILQHIDRELRRMLEIA